MGPGGNQTSPERLRDAISSWMVEGRSFPCRSTSPGCSANRGSSVLDGCLHPGASTEDAGSSTAKTRACNCFPARVPRDLAQK